MGWTLSCPGFAPVSGGTPYTGGVPMPGGTSCTLEMTDSYGDGWNGASWTGYGKSFTLSSGSSDSKTFTVPATSKTLEMKLEKKMRKVKESNLGGALVPPADDEMMAKIHKAEELVKKVKERGGMTGGGAGW